MKLYILLMLLFFANVSFSQWKNETTNNGFDRPFNISKTPLNNKCYLKLEDIGAIDEEKYIIDSLIVPADTVIKVLYSPENPDGLNDTTILKRRTEYKYGWRKVYAVSMDLVGGFFCESNPYVDILLTVGGVDKKYTFKGLTYNNNNKGIQITRNIMVDQQFILDFEKASYISIRVNDTECETEVFRYDMIGSKSAIQFMERNNK